MTLLEQSKMPTEWWVNQLYLEIQDLKKRVKFLEETTIPADDDMVNMSGLE